MRIFSKIIWVFLTICLVISLSFTILLAPSSTSASYLFSNDVEMFRQIYASTNAKFDFLTEITIKVVKPFIEDSKNQIKEEVLACKVEKASDGQYQTDICKYGSIIYNVDIPVTKTMYYDSDKPILLSDSFNRLPGQDQEELQKYFLTVFNRIKHYIEPLGTTYFQLDSCEIKYKKRLYFDSKTHSLNKKIIINHKFNTGHQNDKTTLFFNNKDVVTKIIDELNNETINIDYEILDIDFSRLNLNFN